MAAVIDLAEYREKKTQKMQKQCEELLAKIGLAKAGDMSIFDLVRLIQEHRKDGFIAVRNPANDGIVKINLTDEMFAPYGALLKWLQKS
jgi:protein-disulfide isomerase-like protein with CxxC motif